MSSSSQHVVDLVHEEVQQNRSRLLLSVLPKAIIRDIIHPYIGDSIEEQIQEVCFYVRQDNPWSPPPGESESAYRKHWNQVFEIFVSRYGVHTYTKLFAKEYMFLLESYIFRDVLLRFSLSVAGQLEEQCNAFIRFIQHRAEWSIAQWLASEEITHDSYVAWYDVVQESDRKLPDGRRDMRLVSFVGGKELFRRVFLCVAEPMHFCVYQQLYIVADGLMTHALHELKEATNAKKRKREEEEKGRE